MRQPINPSEADDANKDETVVFPAATFPLRPVLLGHRRDGTRGSPTGSGVAPTLSTSSDGAAQEACQHCVDVKGFTGRGAARKLRKAQEDVDKVHGVMRQLADLTKSIKDRRVYLAVHNRGKTGQLSLRWRRAGVSNTSHVAWHQLNDYIRDLSPDLANWYTTVNEMALALNIQEKSNRSALREAGEELGVRSESRALSDEETINQPKP